MASLIVWTDIPALNLDRAIAFYSAVLGQPVSKQSSEGFELGLFPHSEGGAGGCIYEAAEDKPGATGPLIYFGVNGRLDEAEVEVEKNGGKVLEPKHQIGPHGYRAVVLDSEGNRIALHSPTA